MIIETKFNSGEHVFFMRDGAITEGEIVATRIYVSPEGRIIIDYTLRVKGYVNPYVGEHQDRLFDNVDDLVKSQLNEKAD